MPSNLPHTLICTIGTSLIHPNLANLPENEEAYAKWLERQPKEDRDSLSLDIILNLQSSFQANDLESVALALGQLPGITRLCGAEINSISDLIEKEYCQPNCELFLCHSQTPDGEKIKSILEFYYKGKGYRVKSKEIEGLQDKNPKLFRTKGLRNLAKAVSEVVRDKSPQFCAINATGGYKAQIAIAVLIGQALEVAVYYKHERFSEIISFPPMPIALDFNLWLEKSGILAILEREEIIEWNTDLDEDWNEQMETLIERDGQEIWLSPTGQIFHETFKGRFESDRDTFLPPLVLRNQKIQPELTDHGWGNARSKILNFLQKITDQCSYVKQCRTHYWSPDLSSPVRFRKKGEQIEGIFSNGSWTVKFFVDTSANTEGQLAACIADLNNHALDFQ
jgi:putative CRISPR-associated protein (TIGR02619 family)